MSEIQPKICPKCDGSMVAGGFTVPVEQVSAPEMSQLTPGFMNQGLPPGIESYSAPPIWEERTGEKKGLIFKRPEVKKMRIVGHRCIACNYLEFYAKP